MQVASAWGDPVVNMTNSEREEIREEAVRTTKAMVWVGEVVQDVLCKYIQNL